MTAIFEASLPHEASVLVIGAGGGAEIEALGASPWRFVLTGVDPAAAMLEIARPYAMAASPPGRVRLLQGTVDNLPAADRFGASTSFMVMHFLPDDGEKAAYLRALHTRMRTGAPYLHADVSFGVAGGVKRLIPVIKRFTD